VQFDERASIEGFPQLGQRRQEERFEHRVGDVAGSHQQEAAWPARPGGS
jgi:hypothetical protein